MSAVAYWTVTSTLVARDRVTVKVALTVPVFPSVTVASRMLTDTGSSGDQVPSLRRTESQPGENSATAASGRPSALKSATSMAPFAKGEDAKSVVIGGPKLPSP